MTTRQTDWNQEFIFNVCHLYHTVWLSHIHDELCMQIIAVNWRTTCIMLKVIVFILWNWSFMILRFVLCADCLLVWSMHKPTCVLLVDNINISLSPHCARILLLSIVLISFNINVLFLYCRCRASLCYRLTVRVIADHIFIFDQYVKRKSISCVLSVINVIYCV